MTLYEITENITEEAKEAVTIREASARLNRTVGSLYGAAAEGRQINGRYYLRAADRTLSRNKDRNLLQEYDLVRQQLLGKRSAKKTERRGDSEKKMPEMREE